MFTRIWSISYTPSQHYTFLTTNGSLVYEKNVKDVVTGEDNRWYLVDDKIIPAAWSGSCLAVKNNNFYHGATLSLTPCSTGEITSRWVYNNTYRQLKIKDYQTACIDHGNNIYMWTCADVGNHQWFFEHVVPPISLGSYPFARIMHRTLSQIIFSERGYLMAIKDGVDKIIAESPFNRSDGYDKFTLEQYGDTDGFNIRTSMDTYLYADGIEIKHGSLDTGVRGFYFQFIPDPAGSGGYIIKSLSPSGGFLSTAANMYGTDIRILVTPQSNSKYSIVKINKLTSNSYAKFRDAAEADPKWCCMSSWKSSNKRDSPDYEMGFLACKDANLLAGGYACDKLMTEYCSDPKNKDSTICGCINSSLPFPQCVDIKCANKPAYRTAEMMAECKNITVNDCRQIAAQVQNMGADAKLNINNANFTMICGATPPPIDNRPSNNNNNNNSNNSNNNNNKSDDSLIDINAGSSYLSGSYFVYIIIIMVIVLVIISALLISEYTSTEYNTKIITNTA
jgi:hypothetical protein